MTPRISPKRQPMDVGSVRIRLRDAQTRLASAELQMSGWMASWAPGWPETACSVTAEWPWCWALRIVGMSGLTDITVYVRLDGHSTSCRG
jgi:hypothetical protein